MESIGQYFVYNSEPEQVRDTFIALDNQLKLIHEKGYSVDINSSSIVYENGFGFTRYYKDLTEEKRRKNIEDLAKLALGTYFSLPTGTFSDYTHLPIDYIRNNFEFMESNILKSSENDDYYREVLMNGNICYYNDYLKHLKMNNPQGKANQSSRVLSYSTPQGRAMANKDEAAFINIAFYPITITLFIIISYMIYILVK